VQRRSRWLSLEFSLISRCTHSAHIALQLFEKLKFSFQSIMRKFELGPSQLEIAKSSIGRALTAALRGGHSITTQYADPLLELSRALPRIARKLSFPSNFFCLSLWGEFDRSRWRGATIERKGSQKIEGRREKS
jgi:hypothetical protein